MDSPAGRGAVSRLARAAGGKRPPTAVF